MIEQWKSIPKYPGYEVSDHGRVRSWKTGHPGYRRKQPRILKPSNHCVSDYPYVRLWLDGKGYTSVIHRLVTAAFLGACPDGMEVCHHDGNPRNNHLSNLRYDTRKANIQDLIRHGRKAVVNRKFSPEQIVAIRQARASGCTCQSLADKWDTGRGNISVICTGRTYKHIGGPLTRTRGC